MLVSSLYKDSLHKDMRLHISNKLGVPQITSITFVVVVAGQIIITIMSSFHTVIGGFFLKVQWQQASLSSKTFLMILAVFSNAVACMVPPLLVSLLLLLFLCIDVRVYYILYL